MVHAGWRGLAAGIVDRVLDRVRGGTPSPPSARRSAPATTRSARTSPKPSPTAPRRSRRGAAPGKDLPRSPGHGGGGASPGRRGRCRPGRRMHGVSPRTLLLSPKGRGHGPTGRGGLARMTGDRSEEAATATTGRIREALAEVRDRMADACRRAGRSADDVVVIGATKGVPAEGSPRRTPRVSEISERTTRRSWSRNGPPHPTPGGTSSDASSATRSARSSRRPTSSMPSSPGAPPAGWSRWPRSASPGPDACGGGLRRRPGRRASLGPGLLPGGSFATRGRGRGGSHDRRSAEQDPRRSFAGLRALRDELAPVHPEVRELSMGMSADYEEAVEEGATMVRIGTAIFGPRPGRVRGRAGTP